MIEKLKIIGQYILPKHLVSRLAGKLASAKAGKLTTFLIKQFIAKFKIDMSEAKHSEPGHFKTFNDFFTRELREDVRQVVEGDENIAMPVDGRVSQLGAIKMGRIFQAKGHDFSLRELLGGRDDIAAPFDEGLFATVYLSPKDYHRIHMPITGTLEQLIFIPGDLFSVNPLTAENVPNLFARNERAVAVFSTAIGPMAMVLVGATIVGSIETVWGGTLTANAKKEIQYWDYKDQNISLEKGAEMGRFKLGSTIVALFPKDSVDFTQGLQAGSATRLGELFATTNVTTHAIK
ncbi:MAG: phosphatidylserine decarboxylase [Psychromonas sp.]|jgi:phosphatidylserine decarboxylase|uniref:archaetidylserine decarboxylase n=1 Tax=Psychromonas sp. TaxID=1884585 RepID=UPI0039E22416